MSQKAKQLLRQAVRLYLVEDGATDLGSYRDAVTDLLHLARKKLGKTQSIDMLYHWICSMGYESFQEELENAEIAKVNKIPDSDLPLHKIDEFEFDAAKTQFEERLKSGKGYYGKERMRSLRQKCKETN